MKRETKTAKDGDVPVIRAITPPGLTPGETSEWRITGENLANVERLHVSGAGIDVVEIERGGNDSLRAKVKARADALPGFVEVRVEAPAGLSNLLPVRVDNLSQTPEVEPNDDPAHATPLGLNAAGVGILKARDLDHYRFEGRAGQRVAIEIEAQRLGTPVSPVVTVLSEAGAAIAQGRETRSGDHDAHLLFTLPADGRYVVEVRDNIYGGADTASYRVRIGDAPFATGLFPLGGVPGAEITVWASGGNLAEPCSQLVKLPEEPGTTVEPGVFKLPIGSFPAPARLVAGYGPEISEASPSTPGDSTTDLPLGTTANGRIDRPGEADRYRVKLEEGERVRIKVDAAVLGSWLDSVVRVLGPKQEILAEGDDVGGPNSGGNSLFGLVLATTDSDLAFEPPADGEYLVEISDRYDDGGPEYAYRLTVGPPRPDFSVVLILRNPTIAAGLTDGHAPALPGSTGSLNLRPGSITTLNFLVVPDGPIGPITVRAEGLPPGVSAAPVTVRTSFAPTSRAALRRARPPTPAGETIVLKVAADARPGLGEFRIVATAKLPDGQTIRRVASGHVSLETGEGPRPMVRIDHLPVKLLDPKRAGPRDPKSGDEAR